MCNSPYLEFLFQCNPNVPSWSKVDPLLTSSSSNTIPSLLLSLRPKLSAMKTPVRCLTKMPPLSSLALIFLLSFHPKIN